MTYEVNMVYANHEPTEWDKIANRMREQTIKDVEQGNISYLDKDGNPHHLKGWVETK